MKTMPGRDESPLPPVQQAEPAVAPTFADLLSLAMRLTHNLEALRECGREEARAIRMIIARER
jgi:hypothetical protein